MPKKPAGSLRSVQIRLVVCSKHRLYRAGLRLFVETDNSVTVVAEADSAVAMLTVAQVARPDIILIDDALWETVPDTLWTALQGSAPSPRVLLLTDAPEQYIPQALVRNPELGVVSKGDAPEALLTAIRRLHFGKRMGGRHPERANDSISRSVTATADRKQRLLTAVTPMDGMHTSDPRLAVVLQAVSHDLHKSESIEVLAGRVKISGSRLRHLVRAFIGMSLNQFRKERRLQRALHLLATSHLRVSEIAYEVGIDDVTYFDKEFKKRFGLSPTSYRQTDTR